MPLCRLALPCTFSRPTVPLLPLKFAVTGLPTISAPAPLNAVLVNPTGPACCSDRFRVPPVSMKTAPASVPPFCIDNNFAAPTLSVPPARFENKASQDVEVPPTRPLTLTVPALLRIPP